jgi:hypothetical protein
MEKGHTLIINIKDNKKKKVKEWNLLLEEIETIIIIFIIIKMMR